MHRLNYKPHCSIALNKDFATFESQGSVCAQSCLTLCHPMDCELPFSSVHGISQVRILEWVAISYSRCSSWPKDQTHISVSPPLASIFFTKCPIWEALWVLWHYVSVPQPTPVHPDAWREYRRLFIPLFTSQTRSLRMLMVSPLCHTYSKTWVQAQPTL